MEPRTEDKKQDVSIALMSRDIQYIKESLSKIDQRLELIDGHYIKRAEVEAMKIDADKLHANQAKEIEQLKLQFAIFKTQVTTWGSIGLIVLGIAQFLISKFL